MTGIRSRRARVEQLGLLALAGGALLISAMHYLTDPARVHWHNLFQVLYYIPTVLGALVFGWRAGLVVSLAAALSHLPYILQLSRATPDDAVEHGVEMVLLAAMGILTGILSDRDRRQRRELERTTRELSDVYRELRKNFEQMKRAERLFAVGQLAAGLAHEIRNPLWSIAGAAGILQRNAHLEPKHGECVEIIRKESQRLTRLLSEFLEFARPRPPRFQSTDVRGLLASVIQLAGHAVGQQRVDLKTDAPDNLPEFQGDPEMIKQVLLNLLMNAIQAMPGGGEVRLSAAIEPGKLVFRVRDEGPGIGPEIRDRIFDPFFTTKDGGTGLGLSVAHRIVEQHGGVLTAEPNATQGATFSVVLPLEHKEVE